MPHRPYACGTTGGKPPRKQHWSAPPVAPTLSGKDTNVTTDDEDVPTDKETGHRTDDSMEDDDESTDTADAVAHPLSRMRLQRCGALDGPAFNSLLAMQGQTNGTSTVQTPTVQTPTVQTPNVQTNVGNVMTVAAVASIMSATIQVSPERAQREALKASNASAELVKAVNAYFQCPGLRKKGEVAKAIKKFLVSSGVSKSILHSEVLKAVNWYFCYGKAAFYNNRPIVSNGSALADGGDGGSGTSTSVASTSVAVRGSNVTRTLLRYRLALTTNSPSADVRDGLAEGTPSPAQLRRMIICRGICREIEQSLAKQRMNK
ncbi:hypothetical protein VNI00_016735 [Paramarasmius palmivorus]|uniref:Uncharacterized protein n=1 Tax=Paramarasmius palmivorus TaxID=297713 RepID=A0AAW0BDX5_9AGAR